MKERYSLIIATVLVGIYALPSNAVLIAYEGFDTTVDTGTDVATVGVTGSGFSGYGATDFRMDIEDGLTYQDGNNLTLVVTGKSGGMDVAVSGTQNLQLSLDSTLVNTGTVYMSFLLDVTAVTSWGVMMGLQDSQVGSTAGPIATLEASFRSTASNYGIFASDNTGGADNGIDDRSGPVTGAGSFLVVSELDMDGEVMTTWLNPSDLADVSGSATHILSGTVTGTWDDVTSFIFSLGTQEAGIVDEIRIGDTLADVLPVIDPVFFLTDVEVGDTEGVSVDTVPGILYSLESSDATVTNWTDTGMSVLGTGDTEYLFDPKGHSPTKIYRVTGSVP